MAAILGNVRLDRWQFSDLMAPGLARIIAHAQAALAMPTLIGDKIDDRGHALDRNQRPRVSRMPGLPSRLPVALLPATSHALATGEPVRSRWFRCRGRVLITQRQLPFEISNLFLRVRDLLCRLRQLPRSISQFAAKTLVLVFQPFCCIRAALSPLGLRHASNGTPIGSICTDP